MSDRPMARLLATAETALLSEAHWNFFWSKPGAAMLWTLFESIRGIEGRRSVRERRRTRQVWIR